MGSNIFQWPKWSRGLCRGVVQITLQNLFRGGFGLVSMARDSFGGVACLGGGGVWALRFSVVVCLRRPSSMSRVCSRRVWLLVPGFYLLGGVLFAGLYIH